MMVSMSFSASSILYSVDIRPSSTDFIGQEEAAHTVRSQQSYYCIGITELLHLARSPKRYPACERGVSTAAPGPWTPSAHRPPFYISCSHPSF
ncbi:hypothetical protein EYF80_009192 [Liparis tanakae]|uniref:Uncharacterized protein n=1 Tax=Liparis tanakae TaxID=230148 RepID=A0A4Z2ITD7_9TELE|nr:hypothetical protein EYF80_009192 [Liparis tanakae]